MFIPLTCSQFSKRYISKDIIQKQTHLYISKTNTSNISHTSLFQKINILNLCLIPLHISTDPSTGGVIGVWELSVSKECVYWDLGPWFFRGHFFFPGATFFLPGATFFLPGATFFLPLLQPQGHKNSASRLQSKRKQPRSDFFFNFLSVEVLFCIVFQWYFEACQTGPRLYWSEWC